MDLHHILAIPVPLLGHIIPMLVLCYQLVAKGYNKITILINQDKMEALLKLQEQLEEISERKGVVSVEPLPVVLPPFFTGGDDQIQLVAEELEATAAPALVAARKISSNAPVSCVLADVGLGWAQDTANNLGVPRFALSILALAELTIGVHMPNLIANGSYDPFKEETWEGIEFVQVPGLPPLRPSEIPQVSRFPKSNKVYWAYLLRQYGRAREAKEILVNSCKDLEKDGYEALVENHSLPLSFVGPLLMPPSKSLSKSPCLEWLDQKALRSVIYISFGSFLQWTSSELEEIMFGIQETGYSFLLAFRMDVLLDEASPALEAFLQEFSGDVCEKRNEKQQGFIVSWAPQMEILNHSSTGGYFTHYGWNSVSESIAAGVPMMGKPVLGDQFVMRKLVIEEWKIGVKLEDANGKLTKEAVNEAVMKLMQDDELHANAAKLKECINKTMNEGGDSYQSLEDLSNCM